jgi:hypothetical protein
MKREGLKGFQDGKRGHDKCLAWAVDEGIWGVKEWAI